MGTKSEVSISLTLTVCPTLVILCDPALPNLSTRPETLPSVFFFFPHKCLALAYAAFPKSLKGPQTPNYSSFPRHPLYHLLSIPRTGTWGDQ